MPENSEFNYFFFEAMKAMAIAIKVTTAAIIRVLFSFQSNILFYFFLTKITKMPIRIAAIPAIIIAVL